MDYKIGTIKEEQNRDTYWVRIHLKAPSVDKRSTIIACASYEYLSGFAGTNTVDTLDLSRWAEKVAKKWTREGPKVLSRPVHYDVYALTQKGKQRGREFLKELAAARW
jgi:hypothetical protein